MKDLEEFEKITLQLQKPATTLSDVRAIFDVAIEQYPSLNFYLKANAQIVHSPAFESGIVKVLDGEVEQLTEAERDSIKCFSQGTDAMPAMDENLSLVQKALKYKKRKVIHDEYLNLNFVPPTSNDVDSLFSNASLVLSDFRKSMTTYTFACVRVLILYREYWE